MKTNANQVNLLELLEDQFDEFTPAQRSIAHFLLSHPEEAPFLGVDELADKAKTTASTVVRFAKQLGFQGYPELQRITKEILLEKIKSFGQLERAKFFELPDKETAVYLSLKNDLANLNLLIQTLKESEITSFTDVLISAEKRYILGSRSSFSLAYFFYYQTRKILPDTHLIKNCAVDAYDLIRDMTPRDVLVAISFPRFTKFTLKYAGFAHQRGVRVISITDSKTSSLFKFSQASLFCPYEGVTFHASNAVPMALINAVITDLFTRQRKQSISRLEKEEAILQDLDLLGMRRSRMINTIL